MTVWEVIEKYPPCLIRLLARERKGGKQIRAISDVEIALKSGIPVERIKEISWSMDWEKITVTEMQKYIKGCGFDPHDSVVRNRVSAYRRQRGSKFKYLVNSPWWDCTFLPLIKEMKNNGIQPTV